MQFYTLLHLMSIAVLIVGQGAKTANTATPHISALNITWQLDTSFGANGIVEFDGDATPPSYNFLNYRTFPKADGSMNVLACHLRLNGKTPVDSCSVFAYSTAGQPISTRHYFGRSGFVDVKRYDIQSNDRLIFTAYLEAQRLNTDLTPDPTITSSGLTTLFASGFYSDDALGDIQPIHVDSNETIVYSFDHLCANPVESCRMTMLYSARHARSVNHHQPTRAYPL